MNIYREKEKVDKKRMKIITKVIMYRCYRLFFYFELY